jgi:hypothetical protein
LPWEFNKLISENPLESTFGLNSIQAEHPDLNIKIPKCSKIKKNDAKSASNRELNRSKPHSMVMEMLVP